MKSSSANPTARTDLSAVVFNVQRFSTEDGPGIRTTAFLKGCPLSCPWCHNPESISAKFQVVWHPARCIDCGTCVEDCPFDALTKNESGEIIIDRKLCAACGTCADACPADALEIIGNKMTLDELTAALEADAIFYETSGGGVTFSGGEPLQQRSFLVECLKALKEKGISTAVDTTAFATRDSIDAVAEYTDLFLIDVKYTDSRLHKSVTGVETDLIFSNIAHIANDLKKSLWIRTPLIPGYTADNDNVRSICEFLRDEIPSVERYDLLTFSNLATSKYHALYRKWKLEGTPLLEAGEAEEFARIARSILPPEIVHLSGPTQLPETSETKGAPS